MNAKLKKLPSDISFFSAIYYISIYLYLEKLTNNNNVQMILGDVLFG